MEEGIEKGGKSRRERCASTRNIKEMLKRKREGVGVIRGREDEEDIQNK